MSVQVSSGHKDSVVITSVTPHVQTREDTHLDSRIWTCGGGASGEIYRGAEFTVGEKIGGITYFDEADKLKGGRGWAVMLGKNDAAHFEFWVYGQSGGSVYEWTADLNALIDGKPKKLAVTDSGKPFLIGGIPPNAPEWTYPSS
ncbi:hypothetical protein ABZV61_21815 [Streptomyces sp900116325]|uniref:Aegerolysin n=1 Tax=Streptomyces sp. 900116325 TaxID=3154295 RepID=A0ABV2UF17_9ACTN